MTRSLPCAPQAMALFHKAGATMMQQSISWCYARWRDALAMRRLSHKAYTWRLRVLFYAWRRSMRTVSPVTWTSKMPCPHSFQTT